MEIVKVEQRSEAWYSLRRKSIGASDSGPLLGLSPHKNPHDIWLSKQEGYVSPDNPAMRQGRERESEVLRLFEQESGYLMSPQVIISTESPYLMASLDGYEIDGKCAVEAKCPYSDKAHLQVIHGEIPRYYYAQMQHQMYVSELDEIFFCSYRPEHDIKPLHFEIVKRDEDFIKNMLEVLQRFYEDHMLTGIPPIKEEKFKTIDTDVWKSITEEYKWHDRQVRELEKRKNELRDYLVQIAQEENACGNGITLQKIERKGIINYQNIPILKTMDLEEFRKPSTSFWQVKESSEN